MESVESTNNQQRLVIDGNLNKMTTTWIALKLYNEIIWIWVASDRDCEFLSHYGRKDDAGGLHGLSQIKHWISPWTLEEHSRGSKHALIHDINELVGLLRTNWKRLDSSTFISLLHGKQFVTDVTVPHKIAESYSKDSLILTGATANRVAELKCTKLW